MTTSSEFFRVVLPHLKEEYFNDSIHINLFKKIKLYNETYNKQPKISDIKLLIETDNEISESLSDSIYKFLDSLKTTEEVTDEKLLIKETEKFCQSRALENAILESVEIIQNNKKSKGLIEDIIKEALSVEFEVKLGHDFFEDAVERLKRYLENEDKITLDIDLVNMAMGGGLAKKSIFIFMAQTNVGKTLWLCHCASSLLKSGKNILYVSGEMGFEEIGKRIDANVLDIDISTLSNTVDKKLFKSKFKDIASQAHGKLLIKEVSTGSTNAKHLTNLLNEIKNKKGYVPEILILDHLTLFTSYRLPASQTGTHLYVYCVAEEIRAVAKEFDIVILTAAQFNRTAKDKKTDVSNEDVGLGYGISQTSDWSGALIQTPELKEQNKYILKTIKTRFAGNNEKCYTIGVDYSKMKLLNLDDSQQEIPIHIKDMLKEQQNKINKEESNIGFDFS